MSPPPSWVTFCSTFDQGFVSLMITRGISFHENLINVVGPKQWNNILVEAEDCWCNRFRLNCILYVQWRLKIFFLRFSLFTFLVVIVICRCILAVMLMHVYTHYILPRHLKLFFYALLDDTTFFFSFVSLFSLSLPHSPHLSHSCNSIWCHLKRAPLLGCLIIQFLIILPQF